MKCCHMGSSCAFPLFAKVKGVKKVCSAIKLCSYYFSHYVSNWNSLKSTHLSGCLIKYFVTE